MARNPFWIQQQRAKGLCYICKRPMLDTDPNHCHRICDNLRKQGLRYREIQQQVATREDRPR